jgi:ABC-type nitrate/sulfonate/bicarbonate transport system permease component
MPGSSARAAASGIWPAATFLLVLAVAWEAAPRLGLVSPSSVPTLSAVLGDLVRVIADPAVWRALALTVRTWVFGLVVGAALAIPLGVVLGLRHGVYEVVRVPLEAIRPIPPIVILPLALLVLGGGVAYQVVLVVQGAMWPLLIQTAYAVRHVDATVLDTARSFRLGRRRTLLWVRLPAAAPAVVTGLRLAAATAFAVTVVTELVGGARGVGALMMIAQSGGDVVRVYALTVLIGILGLAITAGFARLERRLLVWQPGVAR